MQKNTFEDIANFDDEIIDAIYDSDSIEYSDSIECNCLNINWKEFSKYIEKMNIEKIDEILNNIIIQIKNGKFDNYFLCSISEKIFRNILLDIDIENLDKNEYLKFCKVLVKKLIDVKLVYPDYANTQAEVYYKHMRYLIFLELYANFFDFGMDLLEQKKQFRGQISAVNKNQFLIRSKDDYTLEFFREEIEKERFHDFISEKSYVMIEIYYELDGKRNKFQKIGYVNQVFNKENGSIYINMYDSDNINFIGNTIHIKKIINLCNYEFQADSLLLYTTRRKCKTISPLDYIIFSCFNKNHRLNENNNKNKNPIKTSEERPIFLFENNNINLNNHIETIMTPHQRTAIESSMYNTITLIQGPPGTGKTKVAVEIVRNWIIQMPKEKILATADSNEAANKLFNDMIQKGINALRYDKNLKKKRGMNYSRYSVYVMTNSMSITDFLNYKFRRVIIDESTQSTEPSTIIPLLKGCEQLVLIGDHKQLPPTVMSTEACKEGYNISLFERLVNAGIKPYLLKTQFRMHPSISQFPNSNFYQGIIQDSNCVHNRRIIKSLNWPNKEYNIAFINNTEEEVYVKPKRSYLNYYEAYLIMKIVKKIVLNSEKISIGIITPYVPQKFHIVELIETFIKNNNLPPFTYQIDTVDGFQGQEKDLIIFSTVRSNHKKQIGFVSDERRINVAMTRAKRGFIVVGNMNTFCNHDSWRRWFKFVDENKLYLDI